MLQRKIQRRAADKGGGGGGAAWKDGPTTQAKSKSHPLATYAAWVKAAEKAYGGSKEALLHRLRRLYYSKHAGIAGGKFDDVIATPDEADLPMTSPPLPKDALDGLFETNYIVTPSGAQVDVSHVFAGLDLRVSQLSFTGEAAAELYGVDFHGVLTWTGDLASWFVEWKNQVAAKQKAGTPMSESDQQALLLSLAANKVGKDDLLGDLDAQVFGGEFAGETYDPATPDDWQGRLPEVTVLEDSVSALLLKYYDPPKPPKPAADPKDAGKAKGGKGKGAEGKGKAAAKKPDPVTENNRFKRFLFHAKPQIPFDVVNRTELKLGAEAEAAVSKEIRSVALLFIKEKYPGGGDGGIAAHEKALRQIAALFVKFLSTGLVKGDSPWPP